MNKTHPKLEALRPNLPFHLERGQAQENVTGKTPETSVISGEFWKKKKKSELSGL